MADHPFFNAPVHLVVAVEHKTATIAKLSEN